MSADLLLGLPAKVKQLLDRLTASRATLLDNLSNLNTTVSSRAPASDTGTLLGRLTQPRADNLDLIPNLEGFGPPTGVMSFPTASTYMGEATYITKALTSMCAGSVVTISPGTTLTETLSLPGPGVLYFLAGYSLTAQNFEFEFQLEIDGVVVTPVDYVGGALGAARCYNLVGGMLADISGGAAGVVFQPIIYKTSIVLKARHSDDGDSPFTAYYRHMPV